MKRLIFLSKGFCSLFILKIIVLGAIFVFQSCSNEESVSLDISNKELALNKFENLVKINASKIKNVVDRHKLTKYKNAENRNDIGAQTEKEIKDALMPLVDGSKELLKIYGVNESDIKDELEDVNDPRIALIGLAILAAESEQGKATVMNYMNIFVTSAYAKNLLVPTAVKCAIEAIGVDAFYSLVSGDISEKAIKKMIKTLAKKILGPIGVGIAVFDFAVCMSIN